MRAVHGMEEAHDIRDRTFSFGAHGYNQDDVDRCLRELADRIESGDVDWTSEIERLDGQTFGVVSLGYWRPDVDTYMAELRSRMVERAGERPMNGSAPEAGSESEPEPDAESEPESQPMPSGWTQAIVERLRRVTEASTGSTALAEVANEPVPDVVSVSPLRREDEVEEETADRTADRVRLFRMAVALGVEDAVSMNVDELVAAIDRVQAGDEEAAADAGTPEQAEDANAALARTKATLASFERMLADQVSQVEAAARHEREAAARDAEAMLRDAELRASEIVAAAERDGDAVGERAQRYSERVRRMADREALRRAAAVEEPVVVTPEPEPEMAAEPDPEPEPDQEPETAPEVAAEHEPTPVEAETEPEAEMAAEPEHEPTPEAASPWTRFRRRLRGDTAVQQSSTEQ